MTGWWVPTTSQNFFHPLVGKLITQLNRANGDAVATMLDPSFLQGLNSAGSQRPFFADQYAAGTDAITVNSSAAAVDLAHELPYANYNWELLYHIPIAVAVHLSRTNALPRRRSGSTTSSIPPRSILLSRHRTASGSSWASVRTLTRIRRSPDAQRRTISTSCSRC